METWVWIIGAYVIGFGLLQLYLYRYYMGKSTDGTRAESAREGTTPGMAESASAAVETPDDVSEEDLVSCANCGVYNKNDPMFNYCKQCGTELK